MTPDEIKSAIVNGVQEAFKNPTLHCRYNISPETHQAQHEKIDAFLNTMKKIDDIKWGVAKYLATVLAAGLVALLGYGALGQLGKLLGIVK